MERSDETGFVHGPWLLGVRVARLDYTFTPVEGGTRYENSITLGPEPPLLRPFFKNAVRPRLFPDDKARAWLKHNVEEVGTLLTQGVNNREGLLALSELARIPCRTPAPPAPR